MPYKNNEPNYKELYDMVVEMYDQVDFLSHGPFDETYYTLRVFNVAEKIMNQLDEKVNKEVVLVSALLHDVGKIKLDFNRVFKDGEFQGSFSEEWRRHSELSVKYAEEIL